MGCKKISSMIILLSLVSFMLFGPVFAKAQEKVGALFVVHGGMDTVEDMHMWNATAMMFSYDHNHAVHRFVIWQPPMWPTVLDTETTEFAARFIRKYEFAYPAIGGYDYFQDITNEQLADMKAELDANPYGIQFEVDWVGWIPGDHIDHYPYPRYIYNPQVPGGSNVTYCGEGEAGGPWAGCDPERFNIDGPVERLLQKGVTRIIMIDLAVGGVRFYKPFDVYQMSKRVVDDWNDANGTSIPHPLWVNDYSDLMERSYPTEPVGWTYFLGIPTADPNPLLNGSPNPVAVDPELALLHVEGIEASMSGAVSDADTGVILFNHGLFDPDRKFFDPKMNDTTRLNENIKSQLLDRHPGMDPDNIVGAFGGIKEYNPANGQEEVNREMRGENLAHVYPLEAEQELSGHPWGYRYWEALEHLKNRGVQHIVFDFPQVVVDSVLSIEVYNQIAKEIGVKTWLQWGTGDFVKYPLTGHPFADYWGIWVNTDCGEWELNYDSGTSEFSGRSLLTGQTSGATGVIKWVTGNVSTGTLTLKELSGVFQDGELITDDNGGSGSVNGTETMTSKPECCFKMGGCGDSLRPYPPPRQSPLNQAMSDLDTILGFDNSDYGHLGYDPDLGPPDPNNPVQDQYTGTWELYVPPDNDPRMGQLLARHVLNAAVNPMVYITNGEISGIEVGENVTFKAHATGGMPGYTYQWSIKEEGDPSWSAVGGNSSTWMWSAESGDEGTYDIRCNVTDAQGRTGDVIWEGFPIVSLYVSTGNYYQLGELGIQVVNIPDTTAPVELDIYTPTVSASYPVVILQHGFSGSIKGYETISTHLASHGFVVVLPQMYPPGDFGGAPTPEEEASLGVQLISWVEAHINNHIPVTADTDLLGLAGHSRGGQTAYRMAVEVPEKVKALAGVDPVDGLEVFGQSLVVAGPLSFNIPTYILGTGLGPVPVGESGPVASCAPEEAGPHHFYCGSPNPTWLVTATTHGHADMIDEEDFSEFCPGGPDRDGMRALTGGTLAAFFSGILQGNESALSVLSDPGSAPVPTEMEMNKKTGGVCGGEVPPSAIPTLSEWGMIIFMTIIVGISVVILSRRRMV